VDYKLCKDDLPALDPECMPSGFLRAFQSFVNLHQAPVQLNTKQLLSENNAKALAWFINRFADSTPALIKSSPGLRDTVGRQ